MGRKLTEICDTSRSRALAGRFATMPLTVSILIAGCAEMAPIVATNPPSEIIVPEHRRGLLMIRNGCTYLQTAGGRYAIVWPAGYRWSIELRGVEAPSGEVFRDREVIRTQGGDGSIEFLKADETLYSKLKKCNHPYTIVSDVRGDEK